MASYKHGAKAHGANYGSINSVNCDYSRVIFLRAMYIKPKITIYLFNMGLKFFILQGHVTHCRPRDLVDRVHWISTQRL